MRIATILVLAMMSAACSPDAAPPASSSTTTDNHPSSDASRTVTTVADVVDAALLRQSFLGRRAADVARDMSILLRSIDAGALTYLQEVWAFDPKVTSELDPDFIRSVPVRAYMANVLAQLAGNRTIKIDLQPVREALRNGLTAPDQDIQNRSMDGLSYIAESIDVDRFVQLADGSNIELAKVSVIALANACGQYAAEQLDGFIQHAKNPEIKADAEAMRSALKDSTAARCAGK